MKVDILCNDGSPLKVIPSDIYDRGVGGAELALLTFAPKLVEAGHQVRVYNNPRELGMHEGVEFLNINQYAPREERDAVIAFRSPNPMLPSSKGRKIFWSCDQQTAGNYSTDIIPFVDHTVVISERHKEYFLYRYKWPEDKMTVLDLGVRTWEYAETPYPKTKGQMIYCSVPDRGLEILHKMWPEIKRRVPHASLVITADYRLWGVEHAGNEKHVAMWRPHQTDVRFLGMVPRKQLVQAQMQSEVHAFPCTYDELFCIAAAECQVAGAVPVTSTWGALATTNRYGVLVTGDPLFSESWQDKYVGEVTRLFESDSLLEQYSDLCIKGGRTDFDWDTLVVAWEGILCG